MRPNPDNAPMPDPTAETAATLADTRTVAEAGPGPSVDPAAATAAAAFVPPDIRDHTLLRRVGQGSYGEVWLARNVMGTFRAVKIVYRNAFDHARPFDREFNGIQKFEPLSRSHDGFVDILQVGRTDACFYYVMELADDVATGTQIDPDHYEPKTLRTEIAAHKRLPFDQCVQLGLSLAHALGHLHSHGLIHRDIKPSNIIFVNGIPKLADIGLVADLNEARSFVGTEGFIPPEGPGTGQADIYSLGKVLYEIATGKDRHEFPTLPTLLDPAPGGAGTDSERGFIELNAVILKACRTELKERYQTCEQLRDDLLLLQSGKSVQRAQALQRRVATLTRLSLAGTALTLLVIAGLVFFQRQATREAALRQRAEQGERAARESQLEAQQNLYAADMNLAFQALGRSEHDTVERILANHQPVSARASTESGTTAKAATGTRREDLRGWEWRLLWRELQDDVAFELIGHTNLVTRIRFSPDGRWLASVGFDHTLRVWDVARRSETRQFALPERLYGLDWSPDGKWLATSGVAPTFDGSVWLYDTTTWHAQRFSNGQWTMSVAFSPDSRWVASYGNSTTPPYGDAKVVVRDLESGAEIWRTNAMNGLAVPIGLRFSADGRHLVYGDFTATRFVDTRSWTEVFRLPSAHENARDIDFSPDGSLVALGYTKERVEVVDLRTRTIVTNLSAGRDWVGAARFSPDGRSLVTITGKGNLTTRSTSTWAEEVAIRPRRGKWAADFSPDGALLATSYDGGRILVRDLTKIKVSPAVPKRFGATANGGRAVFNRWFDPATGDEVMVIYDGATLRERLRVAPPPEKGMHTISSKGDAMAFAMNSGPIRVYRLPADDSPERPNWVWGIPSGTNRIGVHDLAVLPFMEHSAGRSGRLIRPAFSPDDTRIAAAMADGSLFVWNREEQKPLVELASKHRGATSIRLSSGGRLVAVGYSNGEFELWDLERRHLLVDEIPYPNQVSDLTFSPDERRIAVNTFIGPTYFYDTQSGRRDEALFNPLMRGSTLAWLPDGSRLALGLRDDEVVVLWDPLRRQQVGRIDCRGTMTEIEFSADGLGLLISTFEMLRLYRAATWEEVNSGKLRRAP